MLVKNTMTGEKIEKSKAYIVRGKNKNLFFDNEQQYKKYIKEIEDKKLKLELFAPYLQLLEDRGVPFDSSLYTISKRHFNKMLKDYDVKYIDYMFKHISLNNIGTNINFITPKAMYMYFYKVIANKLQMEYLSYLKQKKVESKLKSPELKSDIEFEISKNSSHKKRVTINDYI